MNLFNQILGEFEVHSPEGIQSCFDQGLDPNSIHDGKPLIDYLINMYLRGPRFKDCVQVLVDNGLMFDDHALLAVLLDDEIKLAQLIKDDPNILNKKYTLDCTFTPLYLASLLHISAEYGHVLCTKVLVDQGMDINIKAGTDLHGYGGQSPIFHTVNQHNNNGFEIMKYLVSHHADLDITVKGLIWGKGYEWETYIPSVNPISYAMMGLLRQFQRTEFQIYEIVEVLMKEKYGTEYKPANVPNRYLVRG